MSRQKSLTRTQLAEFLPNPESIRAFEKLQHDVVETLPDAISSQARREAYPWPTQQIEDESNHDITVIQEQKIDRNVIAKSSAYSALDGDFITASANCTITLPSTPETDSVITVRNGDGSYIKIDGNGKTVNGFTSIYTRNKNTVLNVQYLITSDEWVIV